MALHSPVLLNQGRGSVLTSGPAAEPVTAAELRTHLKLTATQLADGEADDLIEEARQHIEDMNNIAMITQSWRLSLDHWPSGRSEWWDGVRQGSIADLYGPQSWTWLTLPRWPLQSVTSVTVYDDAGNATSVTVGDVFQVDTYRTPGRMALKVGQTWPVALQSINAIQIVYVGGYGNSKTDVPGPMKRAVKLMAGYLWSHRGDECTPADAYTASGAAQIMGAFKVKRV